MGKIKTGQIWEVKTNDFYGNKDVREFKTDRKAKFKLNKGEKIEIRYPFQWNYRTEDNLYMYNSEKYILKKCKLIGVVKADVKSFNKANLEEILRLDLYDKI